MSTPFPLEEQAQTHRAEGMWDPWKGPAPSSFGGDVVRSPYTLLEGLGSGAAKGEAVLGGMLHEAPGLDPENKLGPAGLLTAQDRARSDRMAAAMDLAASAVQADARERVKALTPDAATTGMATQVLHGMTSAAEQMVLGSLAGGPVGGAAAVGSGEGLSRFQDLREQGVTPGTAGASAAVTGVTSAAGALVPAAYGSGLVTRLLTGVAGNTAFGVVNRGADHLILAANGYTEMAEQQKVWDGTQMLVDAALGATFGGIHHIQAGEERAVGALKQNTDAALTANLALKDQGSAPGVAVDPASAQAHQAALEKALTDVVQGKPVDVADTGIDRAEFLRRPEPDDTPALQLMANALKESGFLDEEASLRDLEEQFAQRMSGKPESVKPEPAEEPDAYSVREEALTDEQREAFQGLRSDVQTDQELGGSGEREPGQSGPEHVGEPGKEPLTVYRGASHELAPEHFDLESLGKATGHPSSGLGVFFTNSEEEAARYGAVSAHNLDIRNPKLIPADELPGFDTLEEAHAYREKLRAAGYDGITIDASHLGGPVHHVAFEPHQVIPAEAKPSAVGDPVAQALAERPNLEIPGENGEPVKAADALEAAKPETDWFTATKAATDCFSRRGS